MRSGPLHTQLFAPMLRLVTGLLLTGLWALPVAASALGAINGALAVLALAGGAYAVRRLRPQHS
jgi:hypothetical protein